MDRGEVNVKLSMFASRRARIATVGPAAAPLPVLAPPQVRRLSPAVLTSQNPYTATVKAAVTTP